MTQRMLLSGDKVRQHRQYRGLTQPEAAARAGWRTGQVWSKLEVRDTDARIATVAAVAQVLTCVIDDLLVSVSARPAHKRRQRGRVQGRSRNISTALGPDS